MKPGETASAGASPLTTLLEEEQMFRDAVHDFADSEVRPRVAAMDQAAALDAALLPKLFALGLMGIEIPETYGGAGGGLFMTTLAVEELAAVDASAAILVDVQNTLVIEPLLQWATEEQKRRYLTRLAADTVGAYALSEPESGSDAFGLQTKATKQGERWILQGRKLWITNGAEAGVYVIFANTDFTKGYKGITAFIVERGFKGFSVGKKEDKLGIRASSTTELILEGCEVPEANILGEVGKGYKVAIETLNTGRIGIGAQMIGVARGALQAATKYVKERKQFGKAVAEFQAVQFQLAQAATELEAARLMVYNAARLKDAGAEYTQNAAMAKLFSSQVAERVTSVCLELFGGYGYTKEYPVEKFYRDAKIGTIYEGTSNMQLNTIAKLLLR
ncbi:MAG TPA: acyl-CoA dehydrogenase family protein [Gemmatimonadales bacterium]|jgi:alkylation response protein AidB-like acyl-CoA dehydrogenase